MISLLSGKQPFEGIPMSDVMHNVCLQREHLDVPLNCPSELADALTQCWSYSPNDRPSFSYLVNIFKEYLNIVESTYSLIVMQSKRNDPDRTCPTCLLITMSINGNSFDVRKNNM